MKFKKIFSFYILSIVFFAALPFYSDAAVINTSSSSVSVKSGSTFSVSYSLDPQGGKNYTVKLSLGFPSSLVRVTGFSFGGDWIPLPQPGYDQIDNSQGILIKTAGYPKGTPGSVNFGTVTFQAIAEGQGSITMQTSSFALDANNSDTLNNKGASLPLTVTAVTTGGPNPTPTATKPKPTTVTTTPTPTPVPTVTTNQPSILFDISSQPLKDSIGSRWFWWVLGLLVILLIILLLFLRSVWKKSWERKRMESVRLMNSSNNENTQDKNLFN